MTYSHIIHVYLMVFNILWIPNSQQLKGFNIENMNCTQNAALCQNLICAFNSTVEEPLVYHIYFGCTLLKEIPKLSVSSIPKGTVRITSFAKFGRKYKPNKLVSAELDFCKLSTVSANPVFTTFLPTATDQLSKFFGTCPYKTGPFLVDNFLLDGSKIPLMPGLPGSKTEMVFMRGKYQPIFTVVFYAKHNAN